MEHQGDLANLQLGDRFVIADRYTQLVRYAGTMLPDGGAAMDMTCGIHHEPAITVTANELYQMYDPYIHEVTTVGTAV